jgi:hypothetical protein
MAKLPDVAPGKLIKYTGTIENYLDPEFFKPAAPRALVHFMTGSGFGAEIIKALAAQLYAGAQGLQFALNDAYWNSKCEPERGVQCYFTDRSTLVRAQTGRKLGATDVLSYTAQGIHVNVDDVQYNKIAKRNKMREAMVAMSRCKLPELRREFDLAWQLHAAIRTEINNARDRLGLKRYIAIHLRRGDKVRGATRESSEIDLKKWSREIMSQVGRLRCNTLFVATDSGNALREIRRLLPQVHIRTTSDEAQQSFDQNAYNRMGFDTVGTDVARLITDITLLSGAEYYFGTSSSNVTKLVRLMGQDNWTDMEGPSPIASQEFREMVNPPWVHG